MASSAISSSSPSSRTVAGHPRAPAALPSLVSLAMQGSDGFQSFARAGLARLGIEADDTELAVMEAVDSLYRGRVEALLEANLDDVDPEPEIDVAESPRP